MVTVRHQSGGGAHNARHWHCLQGARLTVQTAQAVLLQVEGDVVDVGHEAVRGEVQERRDVLRCWRTDRSGASTVERVVASLDSLQVGRPALHFLPRHQGVGGGGGRPARLEAVIAGRGRRQQVEVEADRVGVRVAVQGTGDVVTVGLVAAPSVRQTSMALEVREVDDIKFE